jgi:hypothetical protein
VLSVVVLEGSAGGALGAFCSRQRGLEGADASSIARNLLFLFDLLAVSRRRVDWWCGIARKLLFLLEFLAASHREVGCW